MTNELRTVASLIALMTIIFCSSLSYAQQGLCEGSLGENIFPDGDFGSGAANVLPNDPGLAPGYIYTTQVPPGDGFYVLTNDMGKWTNIYPSWLPIGDNSADPNGYMMVVNASFTPGNFFEREVTDLCENTLYEFSADVINVITTPTSNHILPNVSFVLDDSVYYNTGSLPQNEQWRTVGFSFTTAPGQETVTLILRNNAPGGLGNDLAIDNISFRPCGPSSEVTTNTPGRICEDATFPTLSADIQDTSMSFIQWQISNDGGVTWTDLPGGTTPSFQVFPVPPGNYVYRFLHATSPANLSNEKCRIVSESLELEVVPIEYLIVDTICDGLSAILGDNTFEQTGIYMDTFTSSLGCDSFVTLDLTVIDDPGIEPMFVQTGPSCNGGDDGVLNLSSVSNGSGPFSFTVESMPITGDSILLPAGDYNVLVTDRYGCFYEGIETVPVTPPFVLGGYYDTTLILGYGVSMIISANFDIASLNWSPSNGLSCSNCIETQVRPFETTTYVIEAVSTEGCEDEASFSITVDEGVEAFVPNVFTPNFDGRNDYWGIYTDPVNVKSIARAVVYNRWGGVEFEATDIPAEGSKELWDGRIDDRVAPNGVYSYIIEFVLADDSHVVRGGTLTVIR